MLKKTVLSSKVKAYYINELDFELAKTVTLLFDNDDFKIDSNIFKKIKDRPNIYVYIMKYQGETYYLKKFLSPTFYNKVKDAIRLSKAVASMLKAYQLVKSGLGVAKPVAALTYKRNIFRKESIYITKRFPGVNMDDFLNNNAITSKIKKEALLEFFIQLNKLYMNAFVQRDTKPENFMIHPTDDNFSFAFIDLESVHHYPFVLNIIILNNLKRIYRYFSHYDFDGCVTLKCNQIMQKLRI